MGSDWDRWNHAKSTELGNDSEPKYTIEQVETFAHVGRPYPNITSFHDLILPTYESVWISEHGVVISVLFRSIVLRLLS